ncbi:MAG TPA: CAP domain-containing protein [Kofleriaceae bacterium]
MVTRPVVDPPPPDDPGPPPGPLPGPPPADETDASYAAARPAGPARPTRSPPRAAPDEATAWVDAHNRVRQKHCAKPLTWSPQLAQVAQRWANSLRDKGCAFGHSGGKFGENLAAGTTGTLDPESVVRMWYDEVGQYRFPSGGFSMKTGHFTQVVWRGTTQVGCGRSHCNDMDIFVCEYDPAGNWEGQYRENVLPAGCRDR